MCLQGSWKLRTSQKEDEANGGLSQWDANWTPTWNTSITQILSLSQQNEKKNFVYPQIPLFSPSSLTSLQSLWLILADRGPVGRESWKGGGEKLYIPEKTFPPSLQEQCRSHERGRSLPGIPGGASDGRCGCYMCPGLER